MLNEANLPAKFWGEALYTFLYINNRLPTTALPAHTTPFEEWHHRKPEIGHLRVFGCRAYVHVGVDKRKSLQSHTRLCIFLG